MEFTEIKIKICKTKNIMNQIKNRLDTEDQLSKKAKQFPKMKH